MLAPRKMAEVETGVLPQSTIKMNTLSGGTVSKYSILVSKPNHFNLIVRNRGSSHWFKVTLPPSGNLTNYSINTLFIVQLTFHRKKQKWITLDKQKYCVKESKSISHTCYNKRKIMSASGNICASIFLIVSMLFILIVHINGFVYQVCI